MITFQIRDGYDKGTKSRKPRLLTVRRMTLAEIQSLGYGDHCKIVANDGSARNVKINGKAQTWKTRPNDVSVPIKYGMYEYARFDTTEALARFIIEITEAQPAGIAV